MKVFVVEQQIEGEWVDKTAPLPRAEADAEFEALKTDNLPIRIRDATEE